MDHSTLTLPRLRFFAAIDLLGLAVALAPLVWLLGMYENLPDHVPTHFGLDQPDAWGPKSRLFWVPSLMLVLYVAITVVGHFPRVWNFPMALREDNAERAVWVSALMLRAVSFVMVATSLYLTVQSARVALGQSEGLGNGFWPAFLGCCLIPLAAGFWALRRAAKPHGPANR